MAALQEHLDRLRACAGTDTLAAGLARAAAALGSASAAGVFLRDYAGERLVLAGSVPSPTAAGSERPDLEKPGLSADNLDDPLAYCLHTGCPAHFLLSFGSPESLRCLSLPEGSAPRSIQVYPLLAPEGQILGGLLTAHGGQPPDSRDHLNLLCLYGGALLALSLEKKRAALATRNWEAEMRSLREAAGPRPAATDVLLGESPALRRLRDDVARLAHSDAPVVITGDTGTGKSLAARLIHQASRRAHAPFMEINCGALPVNLLESELFGHVKGAFSGAVAAHGGLFRGADGGTVFLDEIGELPSALQVVLLQVLQNHKVRPVGATVSYPVDIRIMAATNRNLDQALQSGAFRRDLYHRLAVGAVHMPPLADRRDDIPILAAAFLKRLSGRYGRQSLHLTPEAVMTLVSRSYPGNVRELEGVVERAVMLADPGCTELGPEFLRAEEGGTPPPSLADFLETQKAWLIRKVFALCGGDKSACARILDVHPRTVHRLLQSRVESGPDGPAGHQSGS